MTDWNALLATLADAPRENGSAALARAAEFLREALGESGADVEVWPFTASPWLLRLAGVAILVGSLLYWRWMRAGRQRAALAVALVVPALLLAQLEWMLPVFGWIGAERQVHLVARIPARLPAEQRLVFAAHYDSKTDALDHVERAPIDLLAVPIVALMALGAQRSPGALDDGGSCAVLVRLAEALVRGPALGRTETWVLLLSAEEVGVQGSWAFARERFGAGADLPTFVVNLEGIGASAEHGVLPRERTTLRSFAPDPRIVVLLDAVHARRFGHRLRIGATGGATDARSFLAHGIPAATLISLERGRSVPRGLHSARDDRSRLDPAALDASLAYLLAIAREADARGFELPR